MCTDFSKFRCHPSQIKQGIAFFSCLMLDIVWHWKYKGIVRNKCIY